MAEIRRTVKVGNGGIDLGESAPQTPIQEAAGRAGAPDLANGQVELMLPNGKIVVMGPPKVGTMTLMARLLGDGVPSGIMMGFLKSIFYIRSIDGKDVALPQDNIQVQAIANELGDAGEDIIMAAYSTYWPPVGEADLPVIRKSF